MGRIKYSLGNARANLQAGDRDETSAVASPTRGVVPSLHRDGLPGGVGQARNSLGNAYADLPTGGLCENLHNPIAHFEAALRVYTEMDLPANRAMTQNNLGNAYATLPMGDRDANLRRAIACYESACGSGPRRTSP